MSEQDPKEPVTQAVIELPPNPNKSKMEIEKPAVKDEETETMTTRESRGGSALNDNKFQSEITNFMITTKSKPISQRDPSVISLDSMLGSPVKASTSVAKTEDSSKQDAISSEDITSTTARVAKAESIKILEQVHSDQVAKKMSRGPSRVSLNSRAYRALRDLTCCGTKLHCTSEENINYNRDPAI